MKKIKVWDAPVRLFHWLLVILFALSAYSAFQDKYGIYADIHLYAGLGVLTLILWRILWGLVGSDTARFGHFVKGPKAILAYLRQPGGRAPSVGHNPVGALSVILLVVLLGAQATLGLFGTDAMFFSGPLARTIAQDTAEALTEAHELIGYGLLGLVALHLLAIVGYAVIGKVNLVRPMITGWRALPDDAAAPRLAPPLRALVLLVLSGAVVWFSVF
jgi:cytochrome b